MKEIFELWSGSLLSGVGLGFMVGFICCKRRRGENETEFLNVLQSLLQLLKGIDGEAGCRYG